MLSGLTLSGYKEIFTDSETNFLLSDYIIENSLFASLFHFSSPFNTTGLHKKRRVRELLSALMLLCCLLQKQSDRVELAVCVRLREFHVPSIRISSYHRLSYYYDWFCCHECGRLTLFLTQLLRLTSRPNVPQ